jgi:hypothetical protein
MTGMTGKMTNILKITLAGAVSAAALAVGSASAQPSGAEASTYQERSRADEAAPVCCVIPAGTEVAVQLDRAIGTETVKAGDAFDIHLAAPVIVDGQVILPAGTPGVGRVVQASRPGIGGKGAKLVLSAEYLTVAGAAVKLSAMQLTGTGKDHSTAANALGLGGLVFMPLGIVGIAITGEQVNIPAGTAASAKIAEPTVLPSVGAATNRDFALVWNTFGTPQASRGFLDVPPPPPGLGQVVFFRRKSMTGMQWFNVREEGQALGKLTTGAYFIVPMQPGLHHFTAKSEPELKDHLTLKIDAGETYYVESVMTHGLVMGAAELTPSEKARFDALSGELKPAEVKTADASR